ncbi:DUF4302 domain-containing protein [Bacteroides sp. 51]|uniref:DUF4302 domain-containing protein n=1 Tax=Bacteroides sp. 51 TaxID=2302938 RepID=UPI0013D89AE4|nr:DUF4302 domain-containing protein [Bacteroides sp. 51]NDV83016.1 DUF4302 domain-containing protein [Bacteroides sp. 51]
MKKIYLLLLALPLLLSSCLFDDDDKFDESASERMTQTLLDIQEVLESAQNGWLVEYYPNKDQIYGGYNLFMNFSGGNKVVVASEKGSANQTIESMYDLVPDNGPTLSFNTYNDFIHYFSEPMNKDDIGPDDSGMGGDYEFMVLEATPEKVTLLGKKTRNKIYMTPIASENWADQMEEYISAADKFDEFTNFAYTVNGIEATVKKSYRFLTFTYAGGNDEVSTQEIPYRVVPTGISFYTPITIGGAEVHSMDFKMQGDDRIFTDTGGSNAILKVMPPPPINELFVERTWYMALSGFSQQSNWLLIKTLIMPGLGKPLNWICLSPYEPGIAGFYYNVGGETGLVTFTWDTVDEDKVTIALEGRANNAGITYWQTYFFSYLARPFNGKTFTITEVDSYYNPKEVLLVDVDDPTNTIRFTTKVVSDPFNN